ncbi:MAG: hypothetical protein GY937_12700 [bacterium]|nr:hypothetical protein [bacterium]
MRFPRPFAFCLIVLATAPALAPTAARAGCCTVVKVDGETQGLSARVCEPDVAGACATVLYEGVLTLGGHANVCSADSTVVYQEHDPATGSYGAPVEAVCDGGDVEI